MALRTAEVDTKGLFDSLNQIERVFSHEFLDSKLKILALSILADAVNSPIPRDTGALAESGAMEPSGEGEVTFGFNRKYASIQDLGGSRLPPKSYGSDVGPNFYFSETLRRAGPGVFERITKLIQAEILRIEKRTAKKK